MDAKKPFLTRFAKPASAARIGGEVLHFAPEPPSTTQTSVRFETTDDG